MKAASSASIASAPRDRRFARGLCTHAQDGASGILTATRGKLKRLFCLEKGWVVYATSNLVEEQFPEYLVRSGLLTPQARAAAVEEATAAGTKLVAHLTATGRPSPDEMRRGMEGLIRELITSTLEWPDGTVAFESGLPRLDGEITVRMAPRVLVLAHAKRHPAALDALRVRIGPPDLRPVAAVNANPSLLGLDPVGEFLLERCDGTVGLSALVAGSPGDEEQTLRAVYGFLLAGLLEPEDPEVRRAREGGGRETDVTREECLGRLALSAAGDHYGVLGLDKTARRDAIREVYYAFARRYHPDLFRSGPLSDLQPRIEEFFRRVTEAYNTLYDATRRAEYDQQLVAAPVDEAKTSDTGYLARQNFLRGRALASQKKYSEAVTFLENAVQLDPGQANYHLELGLVLSRNPRLREDAERSLLRAVDLAPTLVVAYVALGSMYLRAGRAGRASRMAREALRWEPDHIGASQLLADAGDAGDDADDSTQRAVFRTG